MKCQILFSRKNMKNISKCRLLKILPRVLSVKLCFYLFAYGCCFWLYGHFVWLCMTCCWIQSELYHNKCCHGSMSILARIFSSGASGPMGLKESIRFRGTLQSLCQICFCARHYVTTIIISNIVLLICLPRVRLQSFSLNGLTNCILNWLSHTIYWNSPNTILGRWGYEIYIFLEKNG